MSGYVASCHSGKSTTGTGTLRIRHVALAACECESVELFVGFVLHVLACQTFGKLMSAAGQLPFPFPHSPFPLSALLCEQLAAVAWLPLEAKQETEITLQTLCSTFSRARSRQAWRIRNAKVK